jgi:arylsulfatase A-like enzyme
VDQPIGGLLRDLKRRGLLDSTLVIWGTEFGRTAITENAKSGQEAGRDHHPHCFSLWLAGGGVRGGTVIGASDELGWHTASDPVHTHDFHATVLHLLGLDHTRLTYRHRGLEQRLTDVAGRVVEPLVG